MPLPDRGRLPDEKVAELAVLFARSGTPHAFGDAIALVYWSEPRGTVDIDINVFLPRAAVRIHGRLGLRINRR